MNEIPTLPANRPAHSDLRSFLRMLEQRGNLLRIAQPVSLVHEMTEIHRRVVAENGPALLFENPVGRDKQRFSMPVLTNLFGTTKRIAWGMGLDETQLSDLGTLMAELRQPKAPHSMATALGKLPMLRSVLTIGTRKTHFPARDFSIASGEGVDLSHLPVQWCWPGEPAPLITWPLVITRSPHDAEDINMGVYRLQVLGPRRLIVRWLSNRGGARHFRQWQALGQDMPFAVVIGADPATILAAVLPLPDTMSELSFSGFLRGTKGRVMPARSVDLPVPFSSEIILEGHVSHTETAPEGPYGDHTGYYNAVEEFPIAQLSSIAIRRDKPIYLSTFTGRPPDEPSRLGEALNTMFVPIVRKHFPEVRDIWLPPEACSYRVMVVSIDKRYEGQARRVMMGLWSILPQFSYCKMVIVVDPDICVRSWPDIVWALATRFEAPRDLAMIENTPMDYLDFASLRKGLGTKLGFDATTKIGSETDREWGEPLSMPAEIVARVDEIWTGLGLSEVQRKP